MRRWTMITTLLGLTAACAAERSTDYALATEGARLYERVLVPPLFEPWARDLVERASLSPDDRVLDLACGTGVVARAAARRSGRGRIVGLDLSPGMLAVARGVPAPDGPSIEWREGNALELPFDDASFDAALCQQGLQFFGDRARALSELRRVLAPGGRLALSVWSPVEQQPYARAFADVVERHLGPAAAAEARSPFPRIEVETLRAEVESAGFRDVQCSTVELPMRTRALREFVAADLSAYPEIGRLLNDAPAARREALIDEIVERLDTYRDESGWSLPWRSHVAVARH